MTIYLDFDGTVVEHDWPKMGRCNFGCMEVILKLQVSSHEVILNTARVDHSEEAFKEALEYLNNNSWRFFKDRDKDKTLEPILHHTKTKLMPQRWDLEVSIYTGIMYIDDIALDMPMKPVAMSQVSKMMVDWDELDKQFEANGIYGNNI